MRTLPILMGAIILTWQLTHVTAEDAFRSDEQNSVLFDASTIAATIIAGQNINGTIGHVYFENLPLDDAYRLVAPDGTTHGPGASFLGRIAFDYVPLHKVGKWDLVIDSSSVIATTFETSTCCTGSGLGIATVFVDFAIDVVTDKNYGPGKMSVNLDTSGAYCDWTTSTTPSGYSTSGSKTRVAIQWKAGALGSGNLARFTLRAHSDGLPAAAAPMSTAFGASGDWGAVSVPVNWKAGGAYDVYYWTEYQTLAACGNTVRPSV